VQTSFNFITVYAIITVVTSESCDGAEISSTVGHLQVIEASRFSLHVSWTKQITANAKNAVADLFARSFGVRDEQFALAA